MKKKAILGRFFSPIPGSLFSKRQGDRMRPESSISRPLLHHSEGSEPAGYAVHAFLSQFSALADGVVTAARTRSSSISTSAGSTIPFLSKSTQTSPCPLAVTVTIPHQPPGNGFLASASEPAPFGLHLLRLFHYLIELHGFSP
jgi:hypothetical protein